MNQHIIGFSRREMGETIKVSRESDTNNSLLALTQCGGGITVMDPRFFAITADVDYGVN